MSLYINIGLFHKRRTLFINCTSLFIGVRCVLKKLRCLPQLTDKPVAFHECKHFLFCESQHTWAMLQLKSFNCPSRSTRTYPSAKCVRGRERESVCVCVFVYESTCVRANILPLRKKHSLAENRCKWSSVKKGNDLQQAK